MQDAGVGYGENEQSLLAAHHPGRHRNGCSAAHDDRYSDAETPVLGIVFVDVIGSAYKCLRDSVPVGARPLRTYVPGADTD